MTIACNAIAASMSIFSVAVAVFIMELDRRKSYIYIMANKSNSVVYVGVTTNLIRRVWQHRNRAFRGFTARYNCDKLVYYEPYGHIMDAIGREKQLKAGSRNRKNILVNKFNPDWKDLSEGWDF